MGDLLRLMKFGFEYETLIEVPYVFQLTLDDLKNNRQHTHLQDCRNNVLRNSDNLVLSRFLLAYFINLNKFNNSEIRNDRDVKIQVGIGYHGLRCQTFSSLITTENDNNRVNPQRAWTITPDGSVSVNDSPNVTSYSNLENYVLDQTIQPPRDSIINNIEVVSHILTWNDINERNYSNNTQTYFQRMLDSVFRVKNSFNYWNNQTTSNHVHISCENRFQIPYNLLKCANAWLFFESIFLLLVAP